MNNLNSGFEIKVLEDEVSSASVLVSWCLSPEWLAKNKEIIHNYYVHLCTFALDKDGNETLETFLKVPVTDQVAYVRFARAGNNRIYAQLLNKFSLGMYDFYSGLASGFINFPGRSCFDPTKEVYSYVLIDSMTKLDDDYIDINLPEECFSSPVPGILWKWVNYDEIDLPRDQCEYRRRLIYALSVKPVLFSALTLIRLLSYLYLFLIGSKNKNFNFEDFKNSYFYSSWINKHSPTPTLSNLALIHTPLLLLVGSLGVVIALLSKASLSLTLILFGSLCVILFGATFWWLLFGVLFFVILSPIASIFSFMTGVFRKGSKISDKDSKISDIDNLSCNKSPSKYSDLAKNKRVWRLKFARLKGKVCKPYQR